MVIPSLPLPFGGHRSTLPRRLAITGAVGAALGTGVLAALWYRLLRRPLPKVSGTLNVEGVSAPVEISRDRWGVPTVTAQSDEDLWFGQGFCHGQDRLWQMDFYRRIATGRLAAIAGPNGLSADRLMRTLGLG